MGKAVSATMTASIALPIRPWTRPARAGLLDSGFVRTVAPRSAKTGRWTSSGPATALASRSASARERGPGISVLISIVLVAAIDLSLSEAPERRFAT